MERRKECEKFNYLAYRHEQMSNADKNAYLVHLRGCDDCKKEAENLEALLGAIVQQRLENRKFCLTEAELTEVAEKDPGENTPVGRHLKMCPFCQSEVELLRMAEIPADMPNVPLTDRLIGLIQNLRKEAGSKIIYFPIRQLQSLTAPPEEGVRLAAAETAEPSQSFERHHERGVLIVASLSGKGELLVNVEREGKPLKDVRVLLEEAPSEGDASERGSRTTDSQGEINFGSVLNLSPPRPGWNYRLKIMLPEAS